MRSASFLILSVSLHAAALAYPVTFARRNHADAIRVTILPEEPGSIGGGGGQGSPASKAKSVSPITARTTAALDMKVKPVENKPEQRTVDRRGSRNNKRKQCRLDLGDQFRRRSVTRTQRSSPQMELPRVTVLAAEGQGPMVTVPARGRGAATGTALGLARDRADQAMEPPRHKPAIEKHPTGVSGECASAGSRGASTPARASRRSRAI